MARHFNRWVDGGSPGSRSKVLSHVEPENAEAFGTVEPKHGRVFWHDVGIQEPSTHSTGPGFAIQFELSSDSDAPVVQVNP